jgi:hypothetical protein
MADCFIQFLGGFDFQRFQEPRNQHPPVYTARKIATAEYIEKLECSICLVAFEFGKYYVTLKCGHIFHEECVKQWVEEHRSCPVCRENV